MRILANLARNFVKRVRVHRMREQAVRIRRLYVSWGNNNTRIRAVDVR